MEKRAERQRGATLVMALVVVLLVTAIAVRMGGDYLLLFRSIEQQDFQQQGRAYMRGAELLAEEALLQDLLLDSGIDSFLEPWAQVRELPLPEGILSACIEDLAARINLNDLGAAAGEFSPMQLRFIRLLQVLPLEEPLSSREALALANAVFDWIDADNEVRLPGGAEALDYQRLTPAYRPANQAFASVAELRLVQGMTPEILAALTPRVSVWGNGSLNFNALDRGLSLSAPDSADGTEPVMLRTLNNADSLLPISPETARRLAAMRSNSGGYVADLGLFTRGDLAALDWDLRGLAVRSDYFRLSAVLRGATGVVTLQSVLERRVDATGVPAVEVVERRLGRGELAEEHGCVSVLP
jgi:type II secretory pathway component PulK